MFFLFCFKYLEKNLAVVLTQKKIFVRCFRSLVLPFIYYSCTLINSNNLTACSVCGTPRSDVQPQQKLQQQPTQSAVPGVVVAKAISPPPPPPQVNYNAGPMYSTPMYFGHTPQRLICMYCNADVITSIRYETGLGTHMMAGGLICIGCWMGCCFVPYCMDTTKDVVHVCPNCRRVVGTRRVLG